MAAASSSSYSLEGRNLKLTSKEDMEPYIAEIEAIEDLQEIHLGGNTLGVGACQALGETLKGKNGLKIADFADIFTGRLISEIPDALRALCDSLVHHTSLVEINLSDNAFGGRSAEPMVNFLTHNHNFAILKLSNNGLGVAGGEIVANALLQAAEELKKSGLSSQLKSVICGRNRLEDGSAPVWAKAFAEHGNLEEVRMFQNGIRMDGFIAITQGLAHCPHLKVLDLQDNTATLRGSRGIAAALPSWSKLEVLNLGDCLLKPKGGYLVVDALGKGSNAALKVLQLQFCDLNRKVLERLGSVIESGSIKSLEKLDINGNWADEEDECIEKIKMALEKHDHADALEELDDMEPDGEDDYEEEEDRDGAEEGSDGEGEKGDQAEAPSESKEEKNEEEKGWQVDAGELAAAAVAVPAATAAVAGASLAGAASLATDNVRDKAEELDLSSALPAQKDERSFAETKNVEEVANTSKSFGTGTSKEEDEAAADRAAEVAEKADGAPEEGVAARNAAEVAESAQAVHAEDSQKLETQGETAKIADEVSSEAQKAGVHSDAEAISTMKAEDAEKKETATSASEVAASAEKIHAVDETEQLTESMGKTQISESAPPPATKTIGRHAQSGSVDLSGELFAEGSQSKAASGLTPEQQPHVEEAPKKKRGFRAAMGAVRELLR